MALFYSLIKIMIRLALKIFCRGIPVTGSRFLSQPGPILVVANHPNSFLDAIIIGSRFSRQVHFLARGDAFNKPWHAKLLRLLNMIPVYRLSEGKENLFLNEAAFQRSKEILADNGIVLIFIEGICVHKHELQTFKKGAARISLENRIKKNLQIVPLGIAYNSFERFGKQVNINIAEPILPETLFPFEEEAKNINYFNSVLFDVISKKIQVPAKQNFISLNKKILFFLPGTIGYGLHFPLYALLKNFLKKKTKGTVFFDSVLFGALLFLYPIYLFLICLILVLLHVPAIWIIAVFLLHPILAWFAVQWHHSH